MNVSKTTKTTRGRQKIEIKKIVNNGHRQVTFTKRRNGLFKKAAELCILTGADMAVFVKSPGGRTYAFGHPDVGAVAERFLGGGGRESLELAVAVAREDLAKGLSGRYDDMSKELAEEKRRGEGSSSVGSDTGSGRFWWEKPIEGLGLDELESYVAALEKLKKKVSMRVDQMMLISASNSMHYSSPMLVMNPISSENSNELAYNHFINQPQASTSVNSLVPSGYDFGYGPYGMQLD